MALYHPVGDDVTDWVIRILKRSVRRIYRKFSDQAWAGSHPPKQGDGAGTSLSVSVRILEGDFSPICMLPDAANEIGCIFTYGYLEHGMTMNIDGYRYLSLTSARQACDDATWSLGVPLGNADVVNACARRLLTFRWMNDGDYGTEDGKK